MASEQSTLLKTAHSVLEAYDTWDIDTILAPRTSNCTIQVLPLRLQRPAQNNSEYRDHFNAAIKPHFKNFTLEVLDTIEDPKRHKVVFHAKSSADTPVGPYANEYTLYLQMTDDDTQVASIKEFVDSQYSAEFFGKLRAHISGS
jgi:ketosteroid isomerase-like protein